MHDFLKKLLVLVIGVFCIFYLNNLGKANEEKEVKVDAEEYGIFGVPTGIAVATGVVAAGVAVGATTAANDDKSDDDADSDNPGAPDAKSEPDVDSASDEDNVSAPKKS